MAAVRRGEIREKPEEEEVLPPWTPFPGSPTLNRLRKAVLLELGPFSVLVYAVIFLNAMVLCFDSAGASDRTELVLSEVKLEHDGGSMGRTSVGEGGQCAKRGRSICNHYLMVTIYRCSGPSAYCREKSRAFALNRRFPLSDLTALGSRQFNKAFTALFVVEMTLKLGLFGPVGYFSDGYNIFDFAITWLGLVEITIQVSGREEVGPTCLFTSLSPLPLTRGAIAPRHHRTTGVRLLCGYPRSPLICLSRQSSICRMQQHSTCCCRHTVDTLV